MSTRSGKRIHNSFHENTVKVDAEVVKSERKTRSRRLKENEDHLDITIPKLKKRHNYVRYPTEDDHGAADVVPRAASEDKHTQKLKRNTLKELNYNEVEKKHFDSTVDIKKVNRVTRRTRKVTDTTEEVPLSIESTKSEESLTKGKTKGKKIKKKSKTSGSNNNGVILTEDVQAPSKKNKKKKKKGKTSKSSVESVQGVHILNNSHISTDSFHSAAGSPLKDDIVELKTSETKDLNTTFEKTITEDLPADITLGSNSKRQRKSSVKKAEEIVEALESLQATERHNSTYDKLDDISADKVETSPKEEQNIRKSLRSNTSFDNSHVTPLLNTTFDKSSSKKSKTISLDTTFDKSDPKLNSTFDKNVSKTSSAKSSLISSDATDNATFDKDNSHISITSDESKTENIVNATPVLIESSMDDSRLSVSRRTIEKIEISDEKDFHTSPKTNKSEVPMTPLKREGTFTKQSPEVTKTTPTKNLPLPSPGYTPFYKSHSTSKERNKMNQTRSIEKPTHRSSLIVPRQTKVMFCSPMNNSAVVSQHKKKVIKSSLKGSNKSFIFDDTTVPRPTARKRSYTHNDAQESRAKRKRLGEELQQSVERLSRPRTYSAAAKLTESPPKRPHTPSKTALTPSKRLLTPSKRPISPAKTNYDTRRTKLPNFAALHQKQFDRMESLDECQDRRAKRARQLMTPNGGVTVLERSSPRAATEPAKTKEIIKKTDTPTKLPKLPTLESLRPGYTRFGFKMHTDFNPFSIPSKNEGKLKEKPNGLQTKTIFPPKASNSVLPAQKKAVQRQPTLPSLNGATTRREAAKLTVMREKSLTSFTNKRDVKRSESRTIIKGVRTNRRFELQMQMRNID